VRVAEPVYEVPEPRAPLRAVLEVWRARGLVGAFTLRELQVRYRQAALGAAWAVARPLALTWVCAWVFGRALGVPHGSTGYPSFAFVGLVAWGFVADALTAAVPGLVQHAPLVRRMAFPREALPLAAVLAAGVDLLVALAVGAGVGLLAGIEPRATWLWAPVLLVVLAALATALALLGAGWNVRLRDVKHALPLLLQVGFFASPIVYPAASVPAAWRPVYDLNPLVAVVEGLRRALLEGLAPEAGPTLYAAGASVALLVVAHAVFRRSARRFADLL
jgi:ABC-type polysaccharide/polyol phosphate export permease